VPQGELTVIVGRNGVGKTTTLDAILGLVTVTGGEIRFEDRRISTLPAWRVPRVGIGYVP
jgi:branched-chain amino acid transport system ATP-binding protein